MRPKKERIQNDFNRFMIAIGFFFPQKLQQKMMIRGEKKESVRIRTHYFMHVFSKFNRFFYSIFHHKSHNSSDAI